MIQNAHFSIGGDEPKKGFFNTRAIVAGQDNGEGSSIAYTYSGVKLLLGIPYDQLESEIMDDEDSDSKSFGRYREGEKRKTKLLSSKSVNDFKVNIKSSEFKNPDDEVVCSYEIHGNFDVMDKGFHSIIEMVYGIEKMFGYSSYKYNVGFQIGELFSIEEVLPNLEKMIIGWLENLENAKELLK